MDYDKMMRDQGLALWRDRCEKKMQLEFYESAEKIEHYKEDMGPVLWWKFPVEEPPYAGAPLDSDWPGYHTHFTMIPTVYKAEDALEHQPNTEE